MANQFKLTNFLVRFLLRDEVHKLFIISLGNRLSASAFRDF